MAASSSTQKSSPVLPSLGGTLGFGDVAVVEGIHVRRKEEPFCVLCNRHFVTQELFDSHLDGFTHRESMKKRVQPGLFGCGSLYEHIYKTLEPIQQRAVD